MSTLQMMLAFTSLLWPAFSSAKNLTAPQALYLLPDWEQFRYHKGFYPYLCEFGYRAIADHVIDPNNCQFDPSKVQLGDSVYVAVWYLDWFVEQVHDLIPSPYVLITCDVGSWIPNPSHMKLAYDPKVICWFAKNMTLTNHSKLFQLPMGQFYYLWAHGIEPALDNLNQIAQTPRDKDVLLYLNHTERNHGRRILVADKFWNQSFCLNRNRPRQPVSFEQFWDEASRSKFVLSPLGLEVDCTRTWECFVLGSIPIVEHSYLDPLYEGLPILLIHNWDEINEEFLSQKYEEIQGKNYKPEKAYIDYWANSIREKQEMARSGNLRSATLEANNFTNKDLKIIHDVLLQHQKLNTPLVYRGNGTFLRSFQLANFCKKLPIVEVYDLWLADGRFSYLKQFSKSKSLIENSRVNVCNPDSKGTVFPGKTYFLDLTHFRHSLLTSAAGLDDFCHSLKQDIAHILKNLNPGDLLMGNMSQDSYVNEVLAKLREQEGMNAQIRENFFYCVKSEVPSETQPQKQLK